MTRGAEDDEAYQNRVNRNNTVLIPLSMWERYDYLHEDNLFERSYIVLIPPHRLDDLNLFPELVLGENALVFYEKRSDWENFPIIKGWLPASNRPHISGSLGGQYIARIPALPTEAEKGKRIFEGYTTSSCKGAGIRFYEYANNAIIQDTKLQLTALFLTCYDSTEFLMDCGHPFDEVIIYRDSVLNKAAEKGLFDKKRLISARILDDACYTICPLCLERISARFFADIMPQSEGREVSDATVTEVSLFHINELKASQLNHKPYNLGWGHHYCNVVVKDAGIENTLQWMKTVLISNGIIL